MLTTGILILAGLAGAYFAMNFVAQGAPRREASAKVDSHPASIPDPEPKSVAVPNPPPVVDTKTPPAPVAPEIKPQPRESKPVETPPPESKNVTEPVAQPAVPDPPAPNVEPEPATKQKEPDPPAMPSTPANLNRRGLLFNSPANTALSVRLDFFRPSDGGVPNKTYFAVGGEKERRFPWNEILLVNAHPGQSNALNNRIQIRARVRGLKAAADTFPVRIYRTFVNDLDDDESVYTNAFTKLFGSAPVDTAGLAKEPEGRQVDLKRVKEIGGDDAVFVSDVIDVAADKDLNPINSALQPPTFAASDADVYYTQWHQTIGDEEPDAWAFGQAMKSLGFISAGVAHPLAKRFTSSNGSVAYQFSLSPKDLLNIRSGEDWEELTDAAAIEEIKKIPSMVRVGSLKDRFKNLGGSKVIGRPVTNGAFVVSTGVQKLVVTAMGSGKVGDASWRFPGVIHVTEGYMDQCLIRAPAQIYLYSGHGWDVSAGGKSYALINCYPKDNLAAFNDATFCPYFASYLPGSWPDDVRAVDTNKIILSEKWKKEELRMQWLFLVGCEVLNRGPDPFRKFRSNCGTFGNLLFKQLGVKGVLGFSEHGFTSASLMKRFVERAATTGIAAEWMKVFRDDEARAYTWYETNETYGRSHQKSFSDLQKIIPAYLVRKENLGDKLTPSTLQSPVGKDLVEFNDLENGKAAGAFSE